jgi:glycosyltransferase involved in cell wall biosynthesis
MIKTPITLQDLPPAPPGKTGWPWTEQTPQLPERMPDGSPWPLISIFTPSYNQGQFIEATIRSILLQGYPNLEYIIIDGGSKDNTVEILQKYEPYLAYWVSEQDRGQADALNKGFRKVTGELIGWQNSDDYYEIGALMQAAKAFRIHGDADVLYGAVYITDAEGNPLETVAAPEFNLEEMFPWFKIHNESMFFKREILTGDYLINEEYHHYMDYELFWRLIFAGRKFQFVPGMLTYHRKHENAKSSTQHYLAAKELFDLYKIAYSHDKLSPQVKQIILKCSKDVCLDNFLKLRLELFRKTVGDLISMAGYKIIDYKIAIKYLLSFLGKRNLKNLMHVKDKIRGYNRDTIG